jgi:hypothetical protein
MLSAYCGDAKCNDQVPPDELPSVLSRRLQAILAVGAVHAFMRGNIDQAEYLIKWRKQFLAKWSESTWIVFAEGLNAFSIHIHSDAAFDRNK